jgi:hypothetical protein
VIIGVDMDKKEIEEMLDYALLTEKEMSHPEKWKNFTDPLPQWESI